ncbi:MAG TPA: class I SAM-dependent methyltransferase [Methylomirabilota bacterium]
MTNPAFSETQLSDRLFQAMIHTLELFGVYLGKRLGLYATLHDKGPLTSAELAAAAGIAERYTREWLEQQAVAGLIAVDDAARPAAARRYSMPAPHVGVLVDPEHAAHLAPFAEMAAGIGGALEHVVDAYRSGAGVPYEAYGAAFVSGQGGINRPAFMQDLTGAWLPAIPDLHGRLAAEPSARVADVGCGVGWSTLALARAYPRAAVTGYDPDAASIAQARQRAAAEGLSLRFEQQNAEAIAQQGPFDLIVVLEALHDMARPTRALAAFRAALAPGGSVLVVDERVSERFVAPGDTVERMMYGWSVVHCLPVAMVEQPSEAIGTAIRPEIVQRCARDAGFARCEVLAIDSPLFRFYRLRA